MHVQAIAAVAAKARNQTGTETIPGKVLVIDDDPVVRGTVKEMLAVSGHEVELASDLETARQAASRHVFDLILLDIVFPQQQYSGFDIIKCIRKHQILCPIVLVTAYPSTRSAVRALREQVFDYLVKPLDFGELAAVVNRAVRYNSRLIKAQGLRDRMDIRDIGRVHVTDREKEVLRLLVKGLSYAEVAEMLGIRISTLQTYTKSIYRKLGVHSRAEAIHEALCLSLIDP